jgi:S1-C subfamily serine protease
MSGQRGSSPWCGVLLAWTVLGAVTCPARAAEPTLAEEAAFRQAVERIASAVVRIEPLGGTAATVGAGAEAVPGSGPTSGLVIDPAGWILTTEFGVPKDVTNAVVVRSDGTRLAARAVGRDTARGIVLLQAAAMPDVEPLTLVPRSELAPGQWAIAVGRGWTHETPNVAVGIVSAVNRAWGRGMQTDAATSPANYGGALVDIRGRVIGVVAPLPADTAGMPTGTELYDAGIGFAVPLDDVVPLRPRLESGETLVPGILGITYRSRDRINGPAVIGSCRQGAPAALAGLQPGDRITAVAGAPVSRIADVRQRIAVRHAGDPLAIEVQRGDATLAVEVTLVAALPPWRRPVLGLVPAATTTPGVTVGWVLPDSPAAAAGIARGDVLTTITRSDPGSTALPIEQATMLGGILAGLEPGGRVMLGVRRGGDERSVECVLDAAPAEVPTDVPEGITLDPGADGAGADPAAVVTLGGADVANPAVAVVPGGSAPRGVLIYLGPPHGAATEAEAEAWKVAAARHGVAVVVAGSEEADRWSRADIAGIERAVAALGARTAIDRGRIAVAGSGAGGAFAWLVAERIAVPVRGVALWDAALPRQAEIRPAEPGAAPWVLMGQGRGDAARRVEDDRRRLEAAGIPVGTLPVAGDATPAEILCSWVAVLGLL